MHLLRRTSLAVSLISSIFFAPALAASSSKAALVKKIATLDLTSHAAPRCERFAAKDYDHRLVIERGDDLTLAPDWESLAAGKTFISYKSFKAPAFRQAFAGIPTLAGAEAFKDGLVTVLLGAFIADNKSEGFFSPEFQLSAHTLETIGRKMTVHGRPHNCHVAATKLVKHSIPFCADIKLQMDLSAQVYHAHTETWDGSDDLRLTSEENASLDAAIGLDPALDLALDHRTIVFSRGTDSLLRGTYFVTNSYKISGTNKSLIVTWQFIGVNVNWLVKSIASLLPRLTHRTVMRDYARFVDAVRELDNNGE